MLLKTVVFLFLCIVLVVPSGCDEKAQLFTSPVKVDCNTLRLGQYLCPDPAYDFIDPETQQIRGCTKDNKAKSLFNLILVMQDLINCFSVLCLAVEGLECLTTKNRTFFKEVPCKWT